MGWVACVALERLGLASINRAHLIPDAARTPRAAVL
jgi:hypothetical protein